MSSRANLNPLELVTEIDEKGKSVGDSKVPKSFNAPNLHIHIGMLNQVIQNTYSVECRGL